MSARRGDVWLLDFGEPIGHEQAGRRPGVVLSDDAMNDGPSGLIIVVPVTTSRRDLASHVELDDPLTGLADVSYATCEDIKSVSERRLIAHLGAVPLPEMLRIEQVVRYLLRL